MEHSSFIRRPLKDVSVTSEFGQLRIKLLKTSVCRFLCGCRFSTFAGKYQGACLLRLMARACLVCEKPPSTSSNAAPRFAPPPATGNTSHGRTSSPARDNVIALGFGHSDSCQWFSLVFQVLVLLGEETPNLHHKLIADKAGI